MHLLVLIPKDTGSLIVLSICFAALLGMVFYFIFRMIELAYVMRKKKPLYVHFYTRLRSLTTNQKLILEQFSFYNKLSKKQKRFFEHRVASFIIDKRFIGREDLIIDDKIKVLISSTAVMLTFGFRDFYIGLIDKIFIYPDVFYSRVNDDYHKGEFNPQLEALVLSWKHFLKGFDKEDDNINLGIHEFTHAIHLNSIKERDISSTIFGDTFKELINLLTEDKSLRTNLLSSNYFRDYAYTNQYEFIASIVEAFIESPQDLRSQFPIVYSKVRQMLNFNFAGY